MSSSSVTLLLDAIFHSQSPGIEVASLVNSTVFLFGLPVLLKGLTGLATANAWFLGTVRLHDLFVYTYVYTYEMMMKEKVMTDKHRYF